MTTPGSSAAPCVARTRSNCQMVSLILGQPIVIDFGRNVIVLVYFKCKVVQQIGNVVPSISRNIFACSRYFSKRRGIPKHLKTARGNPVIMDCATLQLPICNSNASLTSGVGGHRSSSRQICQMQLSSNTENSWQSIFIGRAYIRCYVSLSDRTRQCCISKFPWANTRWRIVATSGAG